MAAPRTRILPLVARYKPPNGPPCATFSRYGAYAAKEASVQPSISLAAVSGPVQNGRCRTGRRNRIHAGSITHLARCSGCMYVAEWETAQDGTWTRAGGAHIGRANVRSGRLVHPVYRGWELKLERLHMWAHIIDLDACSEGSYVSQNCTKCTMNALFGHDNLRSRPPDPKNRIRLEKWGRERGIITLRG